jgi:hypothetical protein
VGTFAVRGVLCESERWYLVVEKEQAPARICTVDRNALANISNKAGFRSSWVKKSKGQTRTDVRIIPCHQGKERKATFRNSRNGFVL